MKIDNFKEFCQDKIDWKQNLIIFISIQTICFLRMFNDIGEKYLYEKISWKNLVRTGSKIPDASLLLP